MSLWKKLVAGISSATARDVILDSATHAQININYTHYEIHEGESFNVNGILSGLASGTAGQTDFVLSTPSTTKWIHMFFSFNVNRKCKFQLWENPTIHVTGDVYNNYNRNRNHSTAANANFHLTNVSATNTNPGGIILLGEQSVGATGIAGGGVGGINRESNEWVLAQNKNYLLRIIPQDADVTVNFNHNWYEHVSRN